MAIAEVPANSDPNRMDATVLPFPQRPHADEGVFLLEQTPLPDYINIEVDTARTSELKRYPDMDTRFGRYWGRHVVMSDGAEFPEFIGIARNPVEDGLLQHSVPAWFESPGQGVVKIENDKLHMQGYHTWTSGIPLNRALPLSRTAFNIHASLTEHAADFSHYFSTDEIKVHGKSNGAMTETGVMAYAEQFGRVITDGYLMDPALVRKLGIEDFKKFAKHPEYLLREGFCLGKQALRLALDPKESALEAARTIELSPEYLIGNLLLTKALFSGEFGHLLAHVPEEQRAHYRLLEHSISNQKRKFRLILRGSNGDARPDITYDEIMGTHISIINPRHTRDMIQYLAA
jgi:hypothetical protein